MARTKQSLRSATITPKMHKVNITLPACLVLSTIIEYQTRSAETFLRELHTILKKCGFRQLSDSDEQNCEVSADSIQAMILSTFKVSHLPLNSSSVLTDIQKYISVVMMIVSALGYKVGTTRPAPPKNQNGKVPLQKKIRKDPPLPPNVKKPLKYSDIIKIRDEYINKDMTSKTNRQIYRQFRIGELRFRRIITGKMEPDDYILGPDDNAEEAKKILSVDLSAKDKGKEKVGEDDDTEVDTEEYRGMDDDEDGDYEEQEE